MYAAEIQPLVSSLRLLISGFAASRLHFGILAGTDLSGFGLLRPKILTTPVCELADDLFLHTWKVSLN